MGVEGVDMEMAMGGVVGMRMRVVGDGRNSSMNTRPTTMDIEARNLKGGLVGFRDAT